MGRQYLSFSSLGFNPTLIENKLYLKATYFKMPVVYYMLK